MLYTTSSTCQEISWVYSFYLYQHVRFYPVVCHCANCCVKSKTIHTVVLWLCYSLEVINYYWWLFFSCRGRRWNVVLNMYTKCRPILTKPYFYTHIQNFNSFTNPLCSCRQGRAVITLFSVGLFTLVVILHWVYLNVFYMKKREYVLLYK